MVFSLESLLISIPLAVQNGQEHAPDAVHRGSVSGYKDEVVCKATTVTDTVGLT